MAKSVTGAVLNDQKTSNTANLEQLLTLGSASFKEPDANDAHCEYLWLFQYAFGQRASDIHIEPRRVTGWRCVFVSTACCTVYQFPPHVTMAIVSRLKELGPDERR